MTFANESYRILIKALQENGYQISDYHNYVKFENQCILRHDIDYSLERALCFAEIEKELGVKSTYFVLVRSDFYNPFSLKSKSILMKICDLGHEIGLHFDEAAYGELNVDAMIKAILHERDMLQDVIRGGVTAVSMHRPSKWVLDADLKIPGMVNSYGKEFFHDFKYVSDSRMRWREDVMKYVTEKNYPKLHILTHAFWYGEEECSMHDVLDSYLSSARKDRYKILNDNFTDLQSIITE